jgi:hypothetical protein
MPKQISKEELKKIYTRKVCTEWSKNPLYNPLAEKKKKLKPTETGVYGKFKKICKDLYHIEVKLSPEESNLETPKEKEFGLTPEQCKELHH